MRFWHRFNGCLFTPLLREVFPSHGHGDGGTQDTQHGMDELNYSLSVPNTRRSGEGNGRQAGPHRGCAWEQSEQAGPGGAGFVTPRQQCAPASYQVM